MIFSLYLSSFLKKCWKLVLFSALFKLHSTNPGVWCFHFPFLKKYFYISPLWFFFLTHGLLRSVSHAPPHPNTHTQMCIFWFDSMLTRKFTLYNYNLLKLVLWQTMCFILENVPGALKKCLFCSCLHECSIDISWVHFINCVEQVSCILLFSDKMLCSLIKSQVLFNNPFALRYFFLVHVSNKIRGYVIMRIHAYSCYFFLMYWPIDHYKIFMCCKVIYFVLMSNTKIVFSAFFATVLYGLSFFYHLSFNIFFILSLNHVNFRHKI